MTHKTNPSRADIDDAILADPQVPIEHRMAMLEAGVRPQNLTQLLFSFFKKVMDYPVRMGQWESGCGFTQRNHNGTVKLHDSSYIKKLIELGAQPFSQTPNALDEAMRTGWSALAIELLQHPECPGCPELVKKRLPARGRRWGHEERDTQAGWLQVAVQRRHPLLVRALLKKGWDANERQEDYSVPLYDIQCVDTLKELLHHGADIFATVLGRKVTNGWFSNPSQSRIVEALPDLLAGITLTSSEKEACVKGLYEAMVKGDKDDWNLRRWALGGRLDFPLQTVEGDSHPITPIGALARSVLHSRKTPKSIETMIHRDILNQIPDSWWTHETSPGLFDGVALWLAANRWAETETTRMVSVKERIDELEKKLLTLMTSEQLFERSVTFTLEHQNTAYYKGNLQKAWTYLWKTITQPMTSLKGKDALDVIRCHEASIVRLMEHTNPEIRRTSTLKNGLYHNPAYWVERGEGAMGLRIAVWMEYMEREIAKELLQKGATWDAQHPLADAARKAWGMKSPELVTIWKAQDIATTLDQSISPLPEKITQKHRM